ncbi:carboxylesterase/lipase family protein [Geobacillus thermodenitrificans]|uniref:carboxylesterase/lipase family protein n=1 Tax=Geobacillus thermodenitrificans TaxID=33940 RepID=UPI00040B9052|nr:carboxylesterase/lipase family protein [Geobacillus thermodenitrificans]ARA98532.1 carboxylesterase [Geobacillus thermodenitrificans]
MEQTVVETKYGRLRGGTNEGVFYWKGIPYAKAPVGERRFLPPEPPDAWDGVREATSFGPVVMQPSDSMFSQLLGRMNEPMSEDGLYLNIWSPAADGKKRPVLFWIHGGAFLFGSGSFPWYDGTAFAKHGDVVVVTINYRMSVFGFLYLGDAFGETYAQAGNLGILDQVAALRWVKENIEAFGGDPDNITIFGESAGAASVGVLLSLPEASGLFRRAILQSGSGSLLLRSPETAMALTERILERAGIRPGDRDRLLSIPAAELLQAAMSLGPGITYGPVVDGHVLRRHPIEALHDGAASDIPILIGVTKDEYNLFSLTDPSLTRLEEKELLDRMNREVGPIPEEAIRYYAETADRSAPAWQTWLRIMTYLVFVDGMLRTADAQAAQGANVYMYRFDYETPAFGGQLKACHTLELPFVFHNLHQPGVENFVGNRPEREAIASEMHGAWLSFARTGNPNGAHLPEKWPVYTKEHKPVFVFSAASHVEDDLFGREREAWQGRL